MTNIKQKLKNIFNGAIFKNASRYYQIYIESIWNGMGKDARAALENSPYAANCLNAIHKFGFKSEAEKELIVSQFYWSVIELYSNTRFMHQFEGFGNKHSVSKDKKKYQDLYDKIDDKTGKLDLPKKYRSIFETKYDDAVGYKCRMRRHDKYPFYIIASADKRADVYRAIQEAGRVPMLDNEKILELMLFVVNNSQIKSTTPKAPKVDGRGHLAVAQEIWDEQNRVSRVLKVQQELHKLQAQETQELNRLSAESGREQDNQDVTDDNVDDAIRKGKIRGKYDIRIRIGEKMAAQGRRSERLENEIEQTKSYYQDLLETTKLRSDLPIQKLRDLKQNQK
ncbi:MAG: hypothetical protein J5608_03250 [Alphaproteobacteria bacterium]|nr:hypothetical protein [Alphaproteobacteria bacterium]